MHVFVPVLGASCRRKSSLKRPSPEAVLVARFSAIKKDQNSKIWTAILEPLLLTFWLLKSREPADEFETLEGALFTLRLWLER